MKFLKCIWHLPRNSVMGFVRLYQKMLSPDHSFWSRGSYCKYRPSCSQYMHASLEKRGFTIGFFKGLWRLLRCNPWSKGGFDHP